jgi:hypothetical protein
MSRTKAILCIALASLVGLSVWAPGRATAEPPPGMSKMWPWNVNPNYAPPRAAGTAPAQAPPAGPVARRLSLPEPVGPYVLQLRPLRDRTSGEEANSVVFVADLPRDTDVWFEDARLPRNGNAERRFVSPRWSPATITPTTSG